VREMKKANGNPVEQDNYERIFAEVRNPSDLRQAIARAVRQLREALEREDNCAVTAAHIRNLTDIDPEALALAYTLAAQGGGVRFGDDETGRRVLLETEAIVAAPALPREIETALALLGSGSTKQGLRYVSQHPVVKGWDNFSGDAASRSAERIEGQWIRCYLRAMRMSHGAIAFSSHLPPLRRTQ
jgi:hypothetical protein